MYFKFKIGKSRIICQHFRKTRWSVWGSNGCPLSQCRLWIRSNPVNSLWNWRKQWKMKSFDINRIWIRLYRTFLASFSFLRTTLVTRSETVEGTFNKLECRCKMWLHYPEVMAYAHCTGTGPEQAGGMELGLMDSNILYRKFHTGPKQEKEPEPSILVFHKHTKLAIIANLFCIYLQFSSSF